MKKYRPMKLFICCLSILCLTLTACRKDAAEELSLGEANERPSLPDSEPIPETQEDEEPEAEGPPAFYGLPVIGEREAVDGRIQSYLTGQWLEEERARRRPIAVMIPNNTPALPQYGLSKAAVIYEAPVEGRITRLMGIFEDYDELEFIGPVRSSRDYYIYVAMGYEAIYCNWGLARPYVEELINRDTVQNISASVAGINHPADEAFGRRSRPGYATEFTGYLFTDGLNKAIERLQYETEYDDAFTPQFTFIADGSRAEYSDREDAVLIYPGGKEKNSGGYGAYNPYFEYHEEDRLYYRYQDGKKQIDEYTGGQLSVSNVVLQYCHGEVRDAKDYLAFGVHGEGEALIFTNGKVIKGTWKRNDGDNTPAKFYDQEDNELVFNQGATWICNIWDEYIEFVSYE
ncbi:MAG: DUF3048 domain-containing protein [Lachnospiraceae bacterium]|nr:DUF3048 domain-containing protein [Lachnospiraceae bacterium]